MPEGTSGSTVPRRQLGRHLRDLRIRAQMTIRSAALRLEWSEAKMWRIETGQVSLRTLDVEAMCRVYGAPPDLTLGLMALAKETKAKGWWHSYGDVIPEGFDIYIGMEQAASRLCWYESVLVPGLLQTEDYARMLIRTGLPDATEEEIEHRVRLRLTRQRLLTRATSAPELNVVLNEAILDRPMFSPHVTSSQLRHLNELGELPSVFIKVATHDVGLHPGLMTGPFVLLEFPAYGSKHASEPPTVYVEGYTGELYLDRPHEIERYSSAFVDIWDIAKDVSTSRNMISDAAREMVT
jgi:hypothetical protein